jgi:phosphoglycerate dehydrogenase-like enzyme
MILKSGVWEKSKLKGTELSYKTLGIWVAAESDKD